MRLSEISYRSGHILLEQGYGRVYNFRYDNYNVDPKPKVFGLGRWRHPATRNTLVCGINLNYLSEEEISQLRKALSAILAEKTIKNRYWKGMKLVPNIFINAYRTYNQDAINLISAETLRKWPSAKAREKESRRKKWREMSPEERAAAYQERARKAAETLAKRARRKPKPPPEYD